MKKENDRKNGLRYNGDMDSFDESRRNERLQWRTGRLNWIFFCSSMTQRFCRIICRSGEGTEEGDISIIYF